MCHRCFVLEAPSSGNSADYDPYLFWGMDDNSSALLFPQSSNIRHRLPPQYQATQLTEAVQTSCVDPSGAILASCIHLSFVPNIPFVSLTRIRSTPSDERHLSSVQHAFRWPLSLAWWVNVGKDWFTRLPSSVASKWLVGPVESRRT